MLGVSLNTLRNWEKSGLLKPVILPNKHRRYTQEQYEDIVGGKFNVAKEDKQITD